MSRFTGFILLFRVPQRMRRTGREPATSPGATVFSLTGTVVGYDGGLFGASVTIMDGIHAGQKARTTDGFAGNSSSRL